MASIASSSSSAAAAAAVPEILEGPIIRERQLTSTSSQEDWQAAQQSVSQELAAVKSERSQTAAGAGEREIQLEAFLDKAQVAISAANQGIQA